MSVDDNVNTSLCNAVSSECGVTYIEIHLVYIGPCSIVIVEE